MLAPKELKRFAIGFIQGSSADFSNVQQWVDSAVGRLDVTEKGALKKYLDELLDGNLDEAALQRIWNDTPADYYMTAHGSVRGFFKMIARQLQGNCRVNVLSIATHAESPGHAASRAFSDSRKPIFDRLKSLLRAPERKSSLTARH